MLITVLSSRLENSFLRPEHSVAAAIHDHLSRFNGVMFLPGIVDQIRGHLYEWGIKDFLVEVDPEDELVISVHYRGSDLDGCQERQGTVRKVSTEVPHPLFAPPGVYS